MSLELRLAAGLSLSLAAAYVLTPLAIRAAARFNFYDKPAGYKGHAAPTPYLGGAAVITGFLLALAALSTDWSRTAPVAGGVLLLWVVGTTDDRRTVPWWLRVVVELALAALLWATDLGWDLGAGGALDLGLTCVWVVAVVNALNLFDNMDGQASTMAAVIAAAVAALGLVDGQMWLAVAGGALAGACIGFLPHNLTSPAKIFLGDGGSMPIGFALAALVMIGAGDATAEWQALAVGLMLVGVPALDTGLVIVSRRRRGISVLTAGRDHLTHRTRERMRTARAVAVALGGGQAVLAVLALVSYRGGSGVLLGAVLAYLALAGTLIAILDAPYAAERADAARAGDATVAARATEPTRFPWEAVVLVPLAVAMAASPFDDGYYASSVWAPAGLVLIVVLVAALIARPPRLDPIVRLALGALVAYGCWALASTTWADSAQQAIVEGNRWLLYAVLLGLLVVLVRSTRAAVWLLGAVGLSSCGVVLFEVARLALGHEGSLFLGGRLHQPLGYINGLATFHAIALFPALALAERRSKPWLAGIGVGVASLAAFLLLLSQSRGVAIAAAAGVLLVLAVVPGRLRRSFAVLALGAGIAVLAGAVSDVYDSGAAGRLDADLLQDTARKALLVALVVGVAWGVLATLVGRLQGARPVDARRLRGACAVGLAALAAVAGVAGLATAGRVGDEARQQYDAFVNLGPGAGGEATGSRLTSGAGNRYDYWRIASRAWRADQLVGVGAGNYDARYFRERSTTEDIRQPHSLTLQTLSELGLVGGLLLLGFLGAVAAAIWRRRFVVGETDRMLGVAATGMFGAWLVHTNVDWIHLLPGVTGLALAAVAILLRPATVDEVVIEPRRVPVGLPRARLVAIPLVGAALLLTGVSLSRQVLSERYARQAASSLAGDPALALKRANQALRLQPEAVPALYTKAAALARFDDGPGAVAALADARRREPDDFVPWALSGDLAARTGRLGQARRFYRAAQVRNPRDPGLRALVRDPGAAVRQPRP